jgi:hypothetical protein
VSWFGWKKQGAEFFCALRFCTLCGSGQPGFHSVGIDEAGLLRLECPVGEDCEIGDALDVEAGSDLGVALGVDFEHDGLTRHVARDLGYMRCGHAAGTAPCSPEIDEDGDAALANDFIKVGRASFYWLSDGAQSVFAGTAFAAVCDVFGRNAVWGIAGRAITDDRHVRSPHIRLTNGSSGCRRLVAACTERGVGMAYLER